MTPSEKPFRVPPYSQMLDVRSPSWKRRACGIVALKSVFSFWDAATPSIDALIKKGVDSGAYLRGIGWRHQGLADIAARHGFKACALDWSSLQKEKAFQNISAAAKHAPVIASIYKDFIPKKGGHLIVITGIMSGRVFYNDPDAATRVDILKSIPVKTFLRGWKMRAITAMPKKTVKVPRRRRIGILGFDKEGQSTYRFLKRTPAYRDAELWILDRNKKINVPPDAFPKLGDSYLEGLDQFDVIVRTPGVKFYAPEIQSAIKSGVEVTSLTKLFFKHARLRTKNIIGVTGTKGKGTTSTLIAKILKASGKKVFIAGNIGTPALDLLPKLTKDSWVILELSSFQLVDLIESPHIAVALMVTSEHLNWHKDIAEYRAAKANIVRFQTARDFAVLARDYPASAAYAKLTKARTFMFSKTTPVKKGAFVENGNFYFTDGVRKEKICETKILQIPGRHNWENVGAAITVAKILRVPNAVIAKTLARFTGLEHRLEFVAEKSGVRYYDDSYATTPETSIAAIAAFAVPKILILGGSSKGSDFTDLGRMITRSESIKAIIGIGAEWPRIKKQIRNPRIKLIEGCATMKTIIAAATKTARPGDVVLLSPACASFGMFKNYSDRGAQFKTIVKKLK
jgi:UDP-N-acetylmuramoylalanine--D-glutamate ligase